MSLKQLFCAIVTPALIFLCLIPTSVKAQQQPPLQPPCCNPNQSWYVTMKADGVTAISGHSTAQGTAQPVPVGFSVNMQVIPTHVSGNFGSAPELLCEFDGVIFYNQQINTSQVSLQLPAPSTAGNHEVDCSVSGSSATIQMPYVVSKPNLVQDPGFESQPNSSVSSPWGVVGTDSHGIDIKLGNARSGYNNGWIYNHSNSGWNAISQTVPVTPNTQYTLTAWVHNNLVSKNGYFGAWDMSGHDIGTVVNYGGTSNYTQLSYTFNSGSNTSVQVFMGFWGDNTDRYIQMDDFLLQMQ